MEAFKISLFEKEHNCFFPSYSSLTLIQGQAVKARIASRFGLLNSSTAAEFAASLASHQTRYYSGNAADDFSLLQALKAINIDPLQEVFINWNHFEKVDLFRTADVVRYFDDL